MHLGSSVNIPIIRTSERSSFRRCPQQWWWAYREGWTPKGKQADARWFGIGVHIALAEWYNKGKERGPHPADTFADWCGSEIAFAKTYLTDTFEEPVWEDSKELGVAMLTAYVEKYGKDSRWDIIAIEQPFSVNVVTGGKTIANFRSRWDGVFRDETDGQVYLLENKTAGQINTAYLPLDDQAGAYWAVASRVLRAKGTLKPKEEIAGIMYNFLRKSKPDDRPVNEEGLRLNQNGTASKRQPPPMFVREVVERSPKEQYAQMKRLADEVTVMNGIRQGNIPIIKNTSKECTWCDFFIPCQLHERGGESWKEVMKSSYIQKDPYEEYSKSA